MKKILLITIFAIGIFINNGCKSINYDNNYRTLVDIANHFSDCGIEIEVIQPLMAYFGANEGITMLIEGKEIGIYKYNIVNQLRSGKAMKRLEDINKKGYVYIEAMKHPVLVNGTFLLIGYETNPARNKIIEAFNSFE